MQTRAVCYCEATICKASVEYDNGVDMGLMGRMAVAACVGAASVLLAACPAYADYIRVGEKTQVILSAPHSIQAAEGIEEVSLDVGSNGDFKVSYDEDVPLGTYKGKVTLSPKTFGTSSISVTWKAWGSGKNGGRKLIKQVTESREYTADEMFIPAEDCDQALTGKKTTLNRLTQRFDRHAYFAYISGFSHAAKGYKLQRGGGYKVYKKAGSRAKIVFTRGGKRRSVYFRVRGTDCRVIFETVHSKDSILKQVREYAMKKLRSKHPVEKKVYCRNNAVYVRYTCEGKMNKYTCWGFYLENQLLLNHCSWW